jgi:arginyl-tRNA synthetase
MDFKLALANGLEEIFLETQEQNMQIDFISLLTTPPTPDMGDAAFPCFRLAKLFRKAPQQIAIELADKIASRRWPWIAKTEAAAGYINVYFNRAFFAEQVITACADGNFGRSDLGNSRVITIDYSSPNIAKHFHVGHLGTTMIGHALVNIFRCLGYSVIGINYLGDWGTQFGKLITAYKKWGNREEIDQTGIDGLTKLYVRFHKEAETDSSLNDEARSWLVKMQNGDEEALALWKWFGELSMVEYQRVYKRLGITFESYRGESYYNDKLDAVVNELREKGLLRESQGAQIVDLDAYKMPPCLILRSDGGSLYPTRDIAAALDRKNTYHFEKSLYVTGMDQSLHFAQWMKVVELMGYDWAKDMTHIPYGLVVFKDGKVSSRYGNVVVMEDILNDAIAKTKKIIDEKNPHLDHKDEIAEQVGIGAVIFNQLYNSRIKDVLFDSERMINFEGETGPYVQYTHARACSILEKAAANTPASINWSLLSDEYSFETLKIIYEYPAKILEAAEKYEPYIISRFLMALAQSFNKFYHNNPILTASNDEKAARLMLTRCAKGVLKSGLALLGIGAPDKM